MIILTYHNLLSFSMILILSAFVFTVEGAPVQTPSTASPSSAKKPSKLNLKNWFSKKSSKSVPVILLTHEEAHLTSLQKTSLSHLPWEVQAQAGQVKRAVIAFRKANLPIPSSTETGAWSQKSLEMMHILEITEAEVVAALDARVEYTVLKERTSSSASPIDDHSPPLSPDSDPVLRPLDRAQTVKLLNSFGLKRANAVRKSGSHVVSPETQAKYDAMLAMENGDQGGGLKRKNAVKKKNLQIDTASPLRIGDQFETDLSPPPLPRRGPRSTPADGQSQSPHDAENEHEEPLLLPPLRSQLPPPPLLSLLVQPK